MATAQEEYIHPTRKENGDCLLRVWQLAQGQYFRMLYADGTEFILNRQGTQVWATWPGSLTLEDTATYFLGPVLGFILRLRGVTCLHASAIAIDGQALAILGPAGAGKSTTAAAFAQLGYHVLSEDVVALTSEGENLLVNPGYPLIRLWPSSVQSLFGAADALPLLTPNWEKRGLPLNRNGCRFQSEPLPLAAIYILSERCDYPSAPFVETPSAQTGLMSLIENTYTNYLLDQAMRAREFELLGRLVKQVPLRRVTPHTDFARLPELCKTILSDFRRIDGTMGDRK
ncbi:MAG: serine/threonine protein kinase [Blastocatellia bacterium]